jgi:hypothetical protein
MTNTVVVTFYIYVLEASNSNLGRDTAYRDSDGSWFSPVAAEAVV